jgi:YD repeat-containing protein
MKVVVQSIAVLSLLFGAALVVGAQQRADAAHVRQQLVGSYKLISYVSYDQNGVATKLPFTVGQISYDAAGRMSAQLMREGRAKLTTPQSSDAERAAAYASFISYFGHYTIEADKGTVTHHVEGAMSPNMVGSDLVRHFEFSPDGKSLFLSVKNGERVTGKLQWDRY